MGFSDNLAALFGYGPSQQAAQQVNVGRAQQSQQLQDEYNQATADPNSGIGLTPAMQQMQENELANNVRSRMSSAGAGRSGAANDSVQKAIVDYRIAQMGKRQQYLDQLRQGMLTASAPQVQQQTTGQQLIGGFAGRAGQAAAQSLFGSDDYDQAQPHGGMGVTQPTGGDPRGQGPSGPNGHGANNAGMYGT